MKSLMLLWNEVAMEFGVLCHTSTDRDQETVRDRVTHEGKSFLTISLPQFCSDFQRSLEQGFVDSTAFAGFRRRGGLPCFLRGFLSRVFSDDGALLPAPDVESILAIRQLTLLFSKIELPCTRKREMAAFRRYLECEQDVRQNDKNRDQDALHAFRRVGSLLFAELFTKADYRVYSGALIPRHGPGATADGLKGNQKYNQREWTERLEEVFPSIEFLAPTYRSWEALERVDILEPGRERPVKVITVPKTLKTPRIIAMEPTCMTYCQQAVLECLVDLVKEDNLLYDLIGFDDQVPNQLLALQGSIKGDLATVDLSDASDRVSNQLVRALLEDHPWLFRAVDASRSRKAEVLGKTIRLAKFASMGSSLCFPFEAMVFLTVVFLGIEEGLGHRLTKKHVQSLRGSVRVYGDDIIVPVDMVSHVIRNLEAFGLKVNRHKSFWTGKFRESCGKEYYDGSDISVVRVRRELPRRRGDVQEIVSTVALRNNFYLSGLWRCARHLDLLLGRLLSLPRVWPTSPSLGLYTFLPISSGRMCKLLHRPLVRGYRVIPRLPRSPLGGEGALLKYFLKRGDEPHAVGHLERSGRCTSLDIRRAVLPPY